MHQLIITIIAIALSAAMALVSVNYIPWWTGHAADVEKVVRGSVPLLESAYIMATRAADGVPPVVTIEADGGLATNFMGLLRFTPAAPSNYTWVYGIHANDGTRYANLNYFCMQWSSNTGLVGGLSAGLERAQSVFSADQFFIGPTCGAITNTAETTGAPSTVTYYVAYAPGVSP
jgi:hypothetical protein